MADILVIEDDALIREVIEMVLGAQHSLRLAGTGLKGLLEARTKTPDLVLLDMGLPELDGYTVAKELRALPAMKTVPILAVTAHDGADAYDAAYAAGCTGFLAKPINEERLVKAVTEQLKGQ